MEHNYISKKTVLKEGLSLEPPIRTYGSVTIRKNCSIGKFSFINNNSTLHSDTMIGRYCSIGKNCELGPMNHPLDWLSTSPFQYNLTLHFPAHSDEFLQKPIKRSNRLVVGNDVWIGSNCIVLRGIKLGDGCVVASGAVVTKDVPPYAIVGGIPAKVLKYRFSEPIIERLLKSKWWELPNHKIRELTFDNVDKVLLEIEAMTSLQ